VPHFAELAASDSNLPFQRQRRRTPFPSEAAVFLCVPRAIPSPTIKPFESLLCSLYVWSEIGIKIGRSILLVLGGRTRSGQSSSSAMEGVYSSDEEEQPIIEAPEDGDEEEGSVASGTSSTSSDDESIYNDLIGIGNQEEAIAMFNNLAEAPVVPMDHQDGHDNQQALGNQEGNHNDLESSFFVAPSSNESSPPNSPAEHKLLAEPLTSEEAAELAVAEAEGGGGATGTTGTDSSGKHLILNTCSFVA